MSQITKLMIFMVCLAAAASVMLASGLAAEIGQQPQPGIEDDVEQTEGDFKEYSASREEGSVTFVGAIVSGIDKAISALKLVFALYPMLVNMGFPAWLATFLAAPVYVVFGLFTLHLLTGRRTSSRL